MQIKKNMIGNLRERLGWVPKAPHNKTVMWFHAVSVGEVLSIQELIKHVKQVLPDSICYLTVGTVAGKHIAQKQVSADYISFLPYDLLLPMLLAFYRIQPSALVIVEADLWPNLIGLAHIGNIPLFLLNARINKKSIRRSGVLKLIFKTLLNCFQTIFTQSENDAEIFCQDGISENKLNILGNIKAFNVVVKRDTLSSKPNPYSGHILLAGSIHPGEDVIYLDIFTQLKQAFSSIKLILAPRHFGWQQRLIDHVHETGLSYFVWTDEDILPSSTSILFTEKLHKLLEHNDILLVCKLGELFMLYPHANIFYLGGTFVPIGGHNLLEPAAWGIPTMIGPMYQNCRDIADRLEALQGIIKLNNESDLLINTMQLLKNEMYRRSISQISKAWIDQESKSVKNGLEVLIEELRKTASH